MSAALNAFIHTFSIASVEHPDGSGDRVVNAEWVAQLQRLLGTVPAPKFPETSCSNCGRSFGPGDHGFSHCDQHPGNVRDQLHAAAPALLAVLEAVIPAKLIGESYDPPVDDDEPLREYLFTWGDLRAARAAIAKARGQS